MPFTLAIPALLPEMELAIRRANAIDIPTLYAILIACAFDLNDRFGLHHWMPPNYLLEEMLKDADTLELYALMRDGIPVGTFTLETTMPSSYLNYGTMHYSLATLRCSSHVCP